MSRAMRRVAKILSAPSCSSPRGDAYKIWQHRSEDERNQMDLPWDVYRGILARVILCLLYFGRHVSFCSEGHVRRVAGRNFQTRLVLFCMILHQGRG